MSFLIQLSAFRPVTLLKKRHWHRCFTEKFVKFLRKALYKTPPVVHEFEPKKMSIWLRRGDKT